MYLFHNKLPVHHGKMRRETAYERIGTRWWSIKFDTSGLPMLNQKSVYLTWLDSYSEICYAQFAPLLSAEFHRNGIIAKPLWISLTKIIDINHFLTRRYAFKNR